MKVTLTPCKRTSGACDSGQGLQGLRDDEDQIQVVEVVSCDLLAKNTARLINGGGIMMDGLLNCVVSISTSELSRDLIVPADVTVYRDNVVAKLTSNDPKFSIYVREN